MFNSGSIFSKSKSRVNHKTIFTMPVGVCCDPAPTNECCMQEYLLSQFPKGVFAYGSKSTFNNSGVSFLPTGNFR